MSDLYPRFISWGQFKSQDEKKPDVIQCSVYDEDTFETQYGICNNVKINNEIRAINLYSFGSANRSLLNQWNESKKKGKIRKGNALKILTWMDTSQRNKDRKIRRYKLVF